MLLAPAAATFVLCVLAFFGSLRVMDIYFTFSRGWPVVVILSYGLAGAIIGRWARTTMVVALSAWVAAIVSVVVLNMGIYLAYSAPNTPLQWAGVGTLTDQLMCVAGGGAAGIGAHLARWLMSHVPKV